MIKYVFLFICLPLLPVSIARAQEAESVDELPDSLYVYTTLEEAMKNPLAVVYLDLSKQKLKEIPAEIFNFTNLVSLNLSRNKITTIPDAISRLKKLEEFDISRNNINELPAALFELRRMKKLALSQNEIERIPAEVKNMQQLEYLDMWDNELWDFPLEMGQLKNLKEFDLRNIQIDMDEQKRLLKLLPNTKIHFSQSCNCGK